MKVDVKIGFVGAGNMAQAIGFGLISAGIAANQLTVSAPSMRNLEVWKKAGVNVTHDNNEVIQSSDVVILSMKPQFFKTAVASFKELPSSKIYVSVLAGITLDSLKKELCTVSGDSQNLKIVRVMPNTPMQVGAGCSVMCANSNATETEVNLVKTIVSVGGICEIVPENMINSISALTGSGPAFIFMVIEALADGAVMRGIPRDLALKLAARMVEGSGRLVAETGKHPGQLKDEVCSPGGTTIVGVKTLESSSIRHAFINAIQATGAKADEMSAMFKK